MGVNAKELSIRSHVGHPHHAPPRALILGVRRAHSCGRKPRGGSPPDRIWTTFRTGESRVGGHGRVGGWRLSAPSPHGMGVLGGLGPPNPMGVEEPDGDPHLGGPPKGALRGVQGGTPLGSGWGPQNRQVPGDPRKPPGGQKSAHFVGYLINLPFGTNMAPLFLGFSTPRDKHGTPPKGGLDTPPKHPPMDPPFPTDS